MLGGPAFQQVLFQPAGNVSSPARRGNSAGGGAAQAESHLLLRVGTGLRGLDWREDQAEAVPSHSPGRLAWPEASGGGLGTYISPTPGALMGIEIGSESEHKSAWLLLLRSGFDPSPIEPPWQISQARSRSCRGRGRWERGKGHLDMLTKIIVHQAYWHTIGKKP